MISIDSYVAVVRGADGLGMATMERAQRRWKRGVVLMVALRLFSPSLFFFKRHQADLSAQVSLLRFPVRWIS